MGFQGLRTISASCSYQISGYRPKIRKSGNPEFRHCGNPDFRSSRNSKSGYPDFRRWYEHGTNMIQKPEILQLLHGSTGRDFWTGHHYPRLVDCLKRSKYKKKPALTTVAQLYFATACLVSSISWGIHYIRPTDKHNEALSLSTTELPIKQWTFTRRLVF